MVVGSMNIETQVLVIGGGPAGYVAAIRASQLGKEVTLVEEEGLGGVCLNHGCIPTKAMIHASNFFNTIKELDAMGISVEKYDVDIAKMREWKEGIISKLSNGIKSLMKKYGVEVIEGRAIFRSKNEVHIEGKSDVTGIKFKKCILATGSSPIEVPGFEFSKEGIISSRDALGLKEVPKKLIIIGGGYIGTEMGTVYGKLGCQVEIVEFQDRLIHVMDPEIVAVVAKKLKNFNVNVNLKSKAKSFLYENNTCKVTIENINGEKVLEADKVLVVVGRKPNTKYIGLDVADVKTDEKGFVIVDEQMKSSNSNIFAIGDIAGQPMLAHKAIRQGKVAAEVIGGQASAYDNKVIPSVVFNDPELVSVGYTLKEAQEKGFEAKEGRYPFSASGRAQTLNETDGFLKLVSDANSGVILGMQAVGTNVSNVVSEVALAIEMGATVEDISLTIHPHPTISEAIMEAADSVLGKNVHTIK